VADGDAVEAHELEENVANVVVGVAWKIEERCSNEAFDLKLLPILR